MSTAERLMRYCRFDTQSDPSSGTHPSSKKQFQLAELLVEELKELGLKDASVDENCYVYAHLESNLDKPCRTAGFIAHMDTAPDFNGSGVNPQIIENYDGTDIVHANGLITKVSDFPDLKRYAGKSLIVTDGTSLLGADDKAGIAAVMETLSYYRDHPEMKHGTIAVAFTPDEEIGEGAMFFDPARMKADFAFTVDGDRLDVYSDETFNGDAAHVEVTGVAVHPGSAKGKLVNAALVAAEFAGLLPDYLTPAHTEGREGFISLQKIQGEISQASLDYILRDHDISLLEKYHRIMEETAALLNGRYGEGTVKITFQETYRNMKEALKDHPEVSLLAEKALKAIGYEPMNVPIRGGTDGSHISFMGLPCPNIGNGGGNFHGPHEYCVIEELEDTSRLIRKIAELTAEEAE
ncbi:MAG: peptidase T [Solobacterium sp.]|nr:peptidase T [Solobacterium sp.]